jgi:transglutaminase superfamily protein
MELLRKFWSLNPGERSLLLRTVLLLALLRAALCLLPFARVSDYLARRAKRHPIRQDIPTSSLVWAIRTAAARIPHTTCLTQALAAKYQLERSGRNAQLHLGVAKENGRLLAHAWLECDGETVLGGEIVDRYAPLVAVG